MPDGPQNRYSDLLIAPGYWERHYGIGSEIDQQEWSLFLRRRDALVDSILQRVHTGRQVASATPGVNPRDSQSIADIIVNQRPVDASRAAQPQTPQDQLNHLLGAAKFYGLEDPERFSPQQLAAYVRQRREASVGDRQRWVQELMKDPTGAGQAMVELDDSRFPNSVVGGLFTGSLETILRTAQHVPFIGDAVSRIGVVQAADQWLSGVEESFRGDLVGSEVTGWNVSKGAGAVLGYALPMMAAWRVVGALGGLGEVSAVGSRMSPIARAAVHGGVATWLLEGGGDDPIEERALRVGAGAGFAGVTAWGLPKVLARLQRWLPSRFGGGGEPIDFASDEGGYAGMRPRDYESPTYDADVVSDPAQLAGHGGQRYFPGTSFRQLPPSEPIEAQPLANDRFTRPVDVEGNPLAVTTPTQTGVMPGSVAPDIETRAMLNGVAEVRQAEMRLNDLDPQTGLADFPSMRRALPSAEADPAQSVVLFDGPASGTAAAVQQAAAELQIPYGAYRYRGSEVVATVPTGMQRTFQGRVSELMDDQVSIGSGQTLAEAESQTLAQREVPQSTGVQYLGMERGRIPGESDIHKFSSPQGPVEITVTHDLNDLRVDWIGSPLSSPGWSDPSLDPKIGPSGLRSIFGTVTPQYPGIESVSGLRVGGTRVASAGTAQARDRMTARIPISRLTRWLSRADAAGEAGTLSKHATVMESPALGEMAQQAAFTDADAVRAAVATNRGEISILRNIGDLGKTIRTIVRDATEGGIGPQDLRLIERPDGQHLLVSDGLPITNKRVQQYRDWGFFAGQRATTKQGQDVVIVEPGLMTKVKPLFGETESFVRYDELMAGASSFAPSETLASAGLDAPALYDRFRDYAMAQMMSDSEDAGLQHFGWLEPQVSSQLPRLIDQFLGMNGIEQPGLRKAVNGYFNARRVEEFKLLAPDEFDAAQEAADEVTAAVAAAQADGRLTSSNYDLAETKGFTLVPYPGSVAWTLRDQISPLEIPLQDDDAVGEFLINLHRELPDYTPLSDMPMEAVPTMPGAPQSIRQESWWQEPEDQADAVAHTGASIVREVIGGGGAGGGGGGDVGMGGGFDEGFNDPPPPTLPQQFRRAGRRELAQVNEWLDGLYVRYGLPFRSLVLGLDERLGQVGVDSNLYQQWEAVSSARAVAHNDAIPFYQEYKGISTRFRRVLKRNGHVVKVQELTTLEDQLQEMQRLGYRPGEIQAQIDLGNFYQKLFGYAGDDGERIFNYISQVRSRQALGVKDPFADPQRTLSPTSAWFAQTLSESGVQMRELNVDLLVPLYIRGMTFQRHVAEPWGAMAASWQSNAPIGLTTDIPQPMRMIVRNYLHNVKFGFDSSYDPMVSGIRSTLNTIFSKSKAPFVLSDSDVRNFWRAGQMSAYRAMLGLKPHVIFRESINHYLAGVKLGFGVTNEVTYRYITDPVYRAEVRARGESQGWRERGAVTLPTGDLFDPLAAANDPNPAVRETFAKIGDWIHDFSPRPLRGGLVGTAADPLHALGQLGVFSRTLAGETGWQVASRALTRFRAGEINHTQLMRESKAAVWRAPVRQRFQELVAAGQDAEAAKLIADEAASTVSRYGTTEHAYGLQGLGTAGRLAMGLGHFTTQHIQYLTDGLLRSDIPLVERAAFMARYGLVGAAIAGASVATGWNFYRWFWGGSLLFTGGPAMEPVARAYQLAGATAAEMQGQYVTEEQRAAQAAMQNPSLGTNAFNSLFPYAGGIRAVSGIMNSALGPNPVEATARFILTGDRSLRSDVGQFYDQLQVYPPGQTPGVPADTIAQMMEADEIRRRSGLPGPTGSF